MYGHFDTGSMSLTWTQSNWLYHNAGQCGRMDGSHRSGRRRRQHMDSRYLLACVQDAQSYGRTSSTIHERSLSFVFLINYIHGLLQINLHCRPQPIHSFEQPGPWFFLRITSNRFTLYTCLAIAFKQPQPATHTATFAQFSLNRHSNY